MSYFIIHVSADGILVTESTKEGIEQDLADGAHNTTLSKVPNDADPNYWPGASEGATLIIKGEVVQPVEVSRVTERRLP